MKNKSELQLSTDLNVITAEINSYKQVAGQAIFEIGRRLKYVKENDLVHGEFGKWLKSVEINQSQASRFIKVYEELGDSNLLTSAKVGFRNLLEIATLPPEEREKEHVTSKGETKTVDEMTVRELQEVKKQLLEAKHAKHIAEVELSAERKERAELEKQKPQVKEVVKEVVPEHIESEIEHLKRIVDLGNSSNKELREQLDAYKMKDASDFDEEKAEKERKTLEWEADKNVLTLKIKVDKFLEEIAVNAFMEGAIATSGISTKKKLRESVDSLKSFTNRMETVLNGRIEI